jgi:hypothetical protein
MQFRLTDAVFDLSSVSLSEFGILFVRCFPQFKFFISTPISIILVRGNTEMFVLLCLCRFRKREIPFGKLRAGFAFVHDSPTTCIVIDSSKRANHGLRSG